MWRFPLPRTHTGMLQGNGMMGVMIWGEDYVLRVTVNRGDFWDQRGGKPWVEGMSYARIFLGSDDGLMLPHAVDDRCTCMGGFWTGSVDHGCTAWVAAMMYRYYVYSGDIAFLRETAYPFMGGAMRVYEEMLERDGDGWVLPVGVSPEYRGAALDAWGRNASFQLACIHNLCQSLVQAAHNLGKAPQPIWLEIQRGLPRAALYGPQGQQEIGLWEGTPLEESHRHHSHLAGICPFDVLDPDDPQWQSIFERTRKGRFW